MLFPVNSYSFLTSLFKTNFLILLDKIKSLTANAFPCQQLCILNQDNKAETPQSCQHRCSLQYYPMKIVAAEIVLCLTHFFPQTMQSQNGSTLSNTSWCISEGCSIIHTVKHLGNLRD